VPPFSVDGCACFLIFFFPFLLGEEELVASPLPRGPVIGAARARGRRGSRVRSCREWAVEGILLKGLAIVSVGWSHMPFAKPLGAVGVACDHLGGVETQLQPWLRWEEALQVWRSSMGRI
jgi:hypothetical protein